jgi:hypothetical protein
MGLHFRPGHGFFFYLAHHLSQISEPSLGHLDKLDSYHIPLVGPLSKAKEAESDSVDAERNFDAHICSGVEPISGLHTATLEAQVEHAAIHQAAIAYQQQRCIVIHLKAWHCALFLVRDIRRILFLWHKLLQ